MEFQIMEPEGIVGKCYDMCPKSEYLMRKKERLLHRLETGDFHPVKEYTRSAAGLADESSDDIRPPHVLQETLSYLLNIVAPYDMSLEGFNFVSNRLRSVKQDLFKQQCPASMSLPLLEPIVCYFAWAAYWYCEEPGFEKHLHDLLLLDCLKECLRLYDQSTHPPCDQLEALYVLYALGKSNGILRASEFLISHRSTVVHLCLVLSLQWFHGNFVAVCKNIKKLPSLLAAFVSVKHLETVRKHGLMVMSNSHSCKNMVTPWEALYDTHLFISKADAIDACKFYSLTLEERGVIFQRTTIFGDAQRPFKKPLWLDTKLEKLCLPSLFFNNEELNV